MKNASFSAAAKSGLHEEHKNKTDHEALTSHFWYKQSQERYYWEIAPKYKNKENANILIYKHTSVSGENGRKSKILHLKGKNIT